MKRNYNMDIIRACATLSVVLYHCWVRTNMPMTGLHVLDLLVSLGGEIGVTAFFMLSGYGIYSSLRAMESQGEIHFGTFMKKRVLRIIPQYYMCLLVCLLLLDGSIEWSAYSIANIATHALLIHNLFATYCSGINYILWTMGVIFQFYLIAIVLYKGINKWKLPFALGSIVFTVVAKYAVFHYLQFKGSDPSFYFIYGRQLFTALDNFVLGMMVAYMIHFQTRKIKQIGAVLLSVISVGLIIGVCALGSRYGIHTVNWSGYLWHSELAIVLSVFSYAFSQIQISWNHVVPKIFLWISKYEYTIYLYHMLTIDTFVNKNATLQGMLYEDRKFVPYIILFVLSILIGYVMSGDFMKMQRKEGQGCKKP